MGYRYFACSQEIIVGGIIIIAVIYTDSFKNEKSTIWTKRREMV